MHSVVRSAANPEGSAGGGDILTDRSFGLRTDVQPIGGIAWGFG
jgi:hypothetical protein